MHASPAKANTRFCTAKSMIDEFKRLINSLNLGQVWEETIQADPVFPVMLKELGGGGSRMEKMARKKAGRLHYKPLH